jgi:hypothetical protein
LRKVSLNHLLHHLLVIVEKIEFAPGVPEGEGGPSTTSTNCNWISLLLKLVKKLHLLKVKLCNNQML